MHERGKSDSSVVPQKLPNKADGIAAEAVEGRELPKGNLREQNTSRTQGRSDVSSALERVRQAAREDRKLQFTALLHHIYDPERLHAAFFRLKRDAVAGVDGETWQHYEENLIENIVDLSARLKRGAYRANPVRRAWIAKSDGRLRPLGVPTLEDKLVQKVTAEVLGAIYEEDFLGFSYGFRSGRHQHQALDALAVGITMERVNWVLDADIRSFFDTLDHEWLRKFVEHRVADQRVVRLMLKWLHAGVLEEAKVTYSEEGTVQGGSISPLLANIYLHYVFDLWVQQWRRTRARGCVIVVRYADDFVLGFEHRTDAEQFRTELEQRLAEFGLALHADKTRLIEFGRHAAQNRRRRGQGKPETFNFLGFTHVCGKSKSGRFAVQRRTMRERVRRKLAEVKVLLRRRMHSPVPDQGRYLRAVITGHSRYYGVAGNSHALLAFRKAIIRLWWRSLRRRTQNHHLPWRRMLRIALRWLPYGRICHPHPLRSLGVIT